MGVGGHSLREIIFELCLPHGAYVGTCNGVHQFRGDDGFLTPDETREARREFIRAVSSTFGGVEEAAGHSRGQSGLGTRGRGRGEGLGGFGRGGLRGSASVHVSRHSPYDRPPQGGSSVGAGDAGSGGDGSGIPIASSVTAREVRATYGRLLGMEVVGRDTAGVRLPRFLAYSTVEGDPTVAFGGTCWEDIERAMDEVSRHFGVLNPYRRGLLFTPGGGPMTSGVVTLGSEPNGPQMLPANGNQVHEDKDEDENEGVDEGGGDDGGEEQAGDAGSTAPRCENCGSGEHMLRQCAIPGPDGPIAICPLCEGHGHCVDECQQWTGLSSADKFEILVVNRALKPRWKTATTMWHQVLKDAKEMSVPLFDRCPWTDEFAVRAMEAHGAKIEMYHFTLDDRYLPIDPQTVSVEMAIKHFEEV